MMATINLRKSIWISLILLLVFLLPLTQVEADIGPKPSFTFRYDFSEIGEPVHIQDVVLYQCDDLDCLEKEELWDVPGQGLECDRKGCYTPVMTGGKAWQIEVVTAEQTRLSQPFIKEGFYSRYDVLLLEDGAEVIFVSASEPSLSSTTTETDSFGNQRNRLVAARAIFFTIFIELPLAAVLLLVLRAGFKNMLWVILGNVVSLALVWFLVPLLPLTAVTTVVLIMLIAVVLEGGVLLGLGGEKILWWKALVISLLINIASTIAGLFVI